MYGCNRDPLHSGDEGTRKVFRIQRSQCSPQPHVIEVPDFRLGITMSTGWIAYDSIHAIVWPWEMNSSNPSALNGLWGGEGELFNCFHNVSQLVDCAPRTIAERIHLHVG